MVRQATVRKEIVDYVAFQGGLHFGNCFDYFLRVFIVKVAKESVLVSWGHVTIRDLSCVGCRQDERNH
jgi:hypothetical protein